MATATSIRISQTRVRNGVVSRTTNQKDVNRVLQRAGMLDENTPRRTRAMKRRKTAETFEDTEITPSIRRPGRAARTSAARTRNMDDDYDYRPRRGQVHPLLYFGTGMLVLILGWVAVWTVTAWWTLHVSDPAAYGSARISIITGVLGHNHDSAEHPTLIEALNYRGQAEIIEVPGGDFTKAKVYPGPHIEQIYGFPGNPKTAIITTEITDFNADGKRDLQVNLCGDKFAITLERACAHYNLINDGKQFKPA
jgi:hypothetical protein